MVLNGGGDDSFVTKFTSAGARIWATYYGGSGGDSGLGITTDSANNIIFTGRTNSADFPVLASFQMALNGSNYDTFIAELNPAGIIIWATYFGGSSIERTFCNGNIVTDNLDNIIICGMTSSTDFPVQSGYQMAYGGGLSDVYVAKFNSTGKLQWSTYFGSALANGEVDGGIATDSKNNIYLLMEPEDVAAPALDVCAYQPLFGGGVEDQEIVKFSPEGKKICASYFGGTGYEDLDWEGAITVSGNTLFICTSNGQGAYGAASPSGGYPVTPGAWQTTRSIFSALEVVLASLCINICEGKLLALDYTAATQSVCTNAPVKFTPTVINSCDTTGYKYHWVFTGATPAVSDSISPTIKFSGAGNYDVKLVVTTLCKKDSLTKANYITVNPCGGCTLNAQYTKGSANCSKCGCKEWIMVTGINGTPPYIYQWPDGYANRYKNGLCPGAYTINVKDKNGCSVNLNVSAP